MSTHTCKAGPLQAPVPRSKEQMSGQIPLLISHPQRAKGQRSNKASPSPSCQASGLPRETQSPSSKPLFQCKDGEGRGRGEEERAGCLGGPSNLDWIGLATGRKRGTGQPTLGRAPPSTKTKGSEALSTCPLCLPRSTLAQLPEGHNGLILFVLSTSLVQLK